MPSCPRCGFDATLGTAECPLCRTPLAPEAGARTEVSAPGRPIAWEDEERSFPGDLLDSITGSLLEPGRFFARVPWEAPLGRPVLYLLIVSVISAFFTLVWSATGVQATELEELQRLGGPSPESFVLLNFTASPFVALIGLLVSTLVLHLFVLMLAPSRRSMRATARVVCYASAPWLLTLVPWVGPLAGTVWSIVLLVLGTKEAHRTTGGRAAAAVLLPLCLFFLLVLLLAVVAGLLLGRLSRLPAGALLP